MARSDGIYLKKKHGQNFLRDTCLLAKIPTYVELDAESSVFEIGCGDGALTREILQHPLERLWVFEIDQEWADLVRTKMTDVRIKVFRENILDVDFALFNQHRPWTLIANLAYHIVFPLFHKLAASRHCFKEGVVMVQEEVAQKLVATSGRGYGFLSLYFQRYFQLTLLDKVSPDAFYPRPKVYSRLIHFIPVYSPCVIEKEDDFWHFIRASFSQPRRMLGNNLKGFHYAIHLIDPSVLRKRAGELNISEFLRLWDLVRGAST